MDKKQRIQAAYEHLRSIGLVHTQKDVAIAMKSTQQNVSAAFGGNEKVLTDRFIARFNAAFDDIFDVNWIITGNGSMLVGSPPEDANSARMLDIIRQQAEEIGKLKQRISDLTQQIEKNASSVNSVPAVNVS